jgi:hypothetical protein
MKLKVGNDRAPAVEDIPDIYELLFIGKYAGQSDERFPSDGFAAVVAKKEALAKGDYELYEDASVAFCGIGGGEMAIYPAWHCHKYAAGGMLEFLKPRSSQEDEPRIFWFPSGYKHFSSLHSRGSCVRFTEEWFFK